MNSPWKVHQHHLPCRFCCAGCYFTGLLLSMALSHHIRHPTNNHCHDRRSISYIAELTANCTIQLAAMLQGLLNGLSNLIEVMQGEGRAARSRHASVMTVQ